MPKKETPSGPDKARTSPTPEELKAFSAFCALFPAFAVTPGNTQKLLQKLWEERGSGTETVLFKLETAYYELAVNGEISLNFAAVGLSREDQTMYHLLGPSELKQLFRFDRKWRRLLEPRPGSVGTTFAEPVQQTQQRRVIQPSDLLKNSKKVQAPMVPEPVPGQSQTDKTEPQSIESHLIENLADLAKTVNAMTVTEFISWAPTNAARVKDVMTSALL